MSNNKSWLNKGGDYFADNRMWRYIAGALFALVAFMVLWNYLAPARQRNMVLNQGDILQHKGMAKEISDFRKAHDGEEPLWTNSMFGGMPSYQISTIYPNNLMQKLDNILNGRSLPTPIGNLFVLFLGLFVLLIALRADPVSAAVASFGFMMCSYYFIVIEAGHNSKVNAVAFLPMVFAGVIYLYRGRYWLGSALTILAMGLEVNANHLQITYYGFFVIGALVLSELSRNVNILGKSVLWVAFSLILICWKLGLPASVWLGLAAVVLLAPLGLAIMARLKEGDTLKALITGKGITEGGKPLRNFLVGTVLMGLCMAISIAPNVGRLMTNSEYITETMRGGAVLQPTAEEAAAAGAKDEAKEEGLKKEYAYVWSYGIYESFSIINPFYFGDAAHAKLDKESETYNVLKGAFPPQTAAQLAGMWPTYIGDQPMHGGPTYMGVVICFLFVLGLLIVPARYRWWLLAATILSIMLSWGRNLQWFSDLFYDNLPKYNNFRAVSMWLTITSVTMATMAGLALKSVFKNEGNRTDKQMITTIGIAAGITVFILAVLAFIQPGVHLRLPDDAGKIAGFLNQVGLKNPDAALVNALAEALPSDRDDLITSQAFKGIGLVLLAAASLIGYAFMRERIKNSGKHTAFICAVGLGLFAMIYIDMVPVNQRYLNDESFIKQADYMRPYEPSAADNMIKADKDPDYRVLNLAANIWNDAITSYHHKSIGGYSAAKLRRYQDLIERCYDKEFGILQAALSVRDSTQMQKIDEALQSVTVLNMMNTKYIIVNPAGGVLPNRHAMGHAWIAANYEVLPKPDDVIAKLQATDLRAKMLVEESSAGPLQGFQASYDSTAVIELTAYQANELKYKFSSKGGKEQLVTFSEVYYNHGKGWKAYIDGTAVEHFRCDYLLRGLRVPAGNHEIVFKMEPHSYYFGETIALITSLLLFGLALGAFFLDYKKGGAQDDDEAAETTVDKKA
jgi:hypothetical protein